MATRNPSRFESYTLSEEEEISGALLTDLQKMFIRNRLHFKLHERLNIEVDPNNIPKFIQHEAELKGTILAYQDLLDSSDEAEKVIAAKSRSTAANS